ncbi:MAG TPA: LAGLIDADG endonuclease [Candidatus Baltobacteraceae bacterium]|nr:LAGLIDADG endonuclease [Candidatus Baltobacteraceae bacterium]
MGRRHPVGTQLRLYGSMLTQRQSDIVTGTLLGDGAMRCKQNALLEINHSVSQRAYVDWLYAELRNLVGTPPKERNGNGARVAYRFTTLSLPALTPLFRSFYPDGKKAIPLELNLNAMALAIWFMDDGCRSRSSVYLNTQQFSMADQSNLLSALDRIGIRGTLNRDKSYYRIRVATGSMPRFAALVRPHILPQMRYKLPPYASTTATL